MATGAPDLDRQEPLRYVVAGMLSTIDFVPSHSHPEIMLDLADKVIHHVMLSSVPGEVATLQPEGPHEGMNERY